MVLSCSSGGTMMSHTTRIRLHPNVNTGEVQSVIGVLTIVEIVGNGLLYFNCKRRKLTDVSQL